MVWTVLTGHGYVSPRAVRTPRPPAPGLRPAGGSASRTWDVGMARTPLPLASRRRVAVSHYSNGCYTGSLQCTASPLPHCPFAPLCARGGECMACCTRPLVAWAGPLFGAFEMRALLAGTRSSPPPATRLTWHVRGRSLGHSRCARSLRGRSFLRLLRPASRGMCGAALCGAVWQRQPDVGQGCGEPLQVQQGGRPADVRGCVRPHPILLGLRPKRVQVQASKTRAGLVSVTSILLSMNFGHINSLIFVTSILLEFCHINSLIQVLM